jgi:uncharacterized membrane protein
MDPRSIPLLLTLLVMGASCHFLPHFMRPNLFFGVTVDRDFPGSEDGKRLLRRYRMGVWCSTAVAIAAALADTPPLFVLLLFLIGAGISSIPAYRAALRHRTTPAAVIEVDMTSPPEPIPGGVIVLLLPFALLLGLGIWVLSPEHPLVGNMVTHWTIAGPDHWVRATPRAIIVRLVRSAFWCLISTVVVLGIMHGSRRVSAAGPAATGERHFRRRVVQVVLLCEYFSVLLAFLSVTQAPGYIVLGVSVAFAIILATFSVSLIRMGQGGSRLSAREMMPMGDRSRDEFWKWGRFYFNRRDRAIFVEARTGVGFTVNFGNVWPWLVLGIIITFPRLLRYIADTSS